MNPRRIAILKPSALGDIAHALPVLSALRQKWPESHITWIVNKTFEPLLAGHPSLNATLAFDRGVYRRSPGRAVAYSLRFFNLLRRQRFDLVLDLQGLLRTGLMCAATGAPVRIGFANAREGSRHFYTHRLTIPNVENMHAVDRYWKFVEHLDAASSPKQFALPISLYEKSEARNATSHLPRPLIAVAVGSRWLTKRWPISHFAELLNRAHTEFGASALLVGAPDDIALSQELTSLLKCPVLDMTGKTSLPRLTALLADSDIMLANDTGPLHLASALGTPCVAPYTCTRIDRHGPYGSPGGGVETKVTCRGSYLKQCPNGLICFNELTADRLWGPLRAALESCRTRS